MLSAGILFMERDKNKKKSKTSYTYHIKYSNGLLNFCLLVYIALIFALGYVIKS